jgi:hypothetical protein
MTERYIKAFALYNREKHEIPVDKRGRLRIYTEEGYALADLQKETEVEPVYILIPEENNEQI